MPTSNAFEIMRPGQPVRLTAAQAQKWTDAAKRADGQPGAQMAEAIARSGRAGVVPIKNGSGADLARFGILGIDGPLFTPASFLEEFKNRIALSGVALAAPAHLGRFAVALEPITDGAIGRAVVSGLVVCKVTKGADRDYRYAEAVAATPGALRAVDSGSARILWHESGSGEKWAIVDVGSDPVAAPFPITMTQTGGSQGTNAAAASWTYTVAHGVTAATLGTGVNPVSAPHLWRRPTLGQVAKATAGLAYTNASGQLVITWCNEVVGPGAC